MGTTRSLKIDDVLYFCFSLSPLVLALGFCSRARSRVLGDVFEKNEKKVIFNKTTSVYRLSF